MTRGAPVRWRRRAPFLVLASLLLAACSLLDPDNDDRIALERARSRWEAIGPPSYTYLVRRACECLPGTTGPFEVKVVDGERQAVIRPETGEELEASLADAFPTVVGFFDIVDDALRRGAHRVDVDYDAATGTPVRVSIDYDERVADEELLYWSTLPEPLG